MSMRKSMVTATSIKLRGCTESDRGRRNPIPRSSGNSVLKGSWETRKRMRKRACIDGSNISKADSQAVTLNESMCEFAKTSINANTYSLQL